MKKIFNLISVFATLVIFNGSLQAQKTKNTQLAVSPTDVLKDSVVQHAIHTLSATATASVNPNPKPPANERQAGPHNKDITVIELSSKDSSHEFDALLVYKNKSGKTMALFYSPNATYKPVNNHIRDIVKNFVPGIDGGGGGINVNFPSFVNLSNGSAVNVPDDGSWSAWTNTGISCDPDINCIWGLIKGMKYQTTMRVRRMPYFNIGVEGILSFPGFPGIIEVEYRNVYFMCRCR